MIKKYNKAIPLLFAAIIMISLGSCDPSKKLEKEESAIILAYLGSNSNMNFVKKPSGLYYLEVVAGSGRVPVAHDTAYVFYTGKLLDGTIFDTNVGTTDTLIFPMEEGWLNLTGIDEGVTYMKGGGKAIFLIPSKLAYGAYGAYPYIQGYTPLLFDVELVRVKAGPGI